MLIVLVRVPCLEEGALGLLERVSSIQVAPEGWPRKGKGEEEDGEKEARPGGVFL